MGAPPFAAFRTPPKGVYSEPAPDRSYQVRLNKLKADLGVLLRVVVDIRPAPLQQSLGALEEELEPFLAATIPIFALARIDA